MTVLWEYMTKGSVGAASAARGAMSKLSNIAIAVGLRLI